LRCDTHVVLKAGERVAVARVPVKYDRTTVTLDWKTPQIENQFQGTKMEEFRKTLLDDKSIIMRVEDDQKFLYNPETESRWKRTEQALTLGH
jgi:hypothetical protein